MKQWRAVWNTGKGDVALALWAENEAAAWQLAENMVTLLMAGSRVPVVMRLEEETA